jgi:D-alanyl-D-alanine carboxypeptidase
MSVMSGLRTIAKLLTVAFVCLAGIASCRTLESNEEPDLTQLPFAHDLQGAIEQVLHTTQEQDELGISAAVIVPGYKTWFGVTGFSHPNVPITADMLFDVGSVQKNFEAALVLQLAEGGRLSLDDPIDQYLPAYTNVDGKITIRQLLNHTSGIYNVFEHPDFPWVRSDIDYSKVWQKEEVFTSFVLSPYGPPGYAQHYSSTNYLLITAIVEKVTGAAVPEEIERVFLNPLQLEHTFVSMGQLPPASYAVAHPWVDIDQDGKLDDLHGLPRTWIATLTHPVMFSTPQDLAYWLNALYHERVVLSSSSMVEMLTFPETTLQDPDGRQLGLGVMEYTDILDMPVFGHGGSSLGYSAAALYLPEVGVSIAWLINTGESPPELANQLMNQTWSALSDVLLANQEFLPPEAP